MSFKSVRRMAADILKCGENRVWIDPGSIDELKNIVTKNDVRTAIKAGAIKKGVVVGTSRARANAIKMKKRNNRKSGPGTRKGGKYSVISRKDRWVKQIRAIRSELKMLKNNKAISRKVYRQFYKRVKSGIIKSRLHLRMHLKVEGHLKE